MHEEIMIKPKRKEKRKGLRLLLIILSIATLLLIGMLVEVFLEASDRLDFPPVGTIVEVNGHDMHLWAEGTGDVTLVFTVGWKMPSAYMDFYPLRSALVDHTRVAIYDRPGYGWSEVADTPRDIDTMAEELHMLLDQAGEKPPYVMVAHSIGSLEVIRYAQLYPDEVVGMVLLDATNPAMYEDGGRSYGLSFRLANLRNSALAILNRTGITRLLFSTVYPYEKTPFGAGRKATIEIPEELRRLEKAMFLADFNNKNQVDENTRKEENAKTVLAHGTLGDLPLLVFTSEEYTGYSGINELQQDLLNWSADSRQIVVEGAGHALYWHNPKLINDEILDFVR